MTPINILVLALLLAGCTDIPSVDEISNSTALYNKLSAKCHGMTVNDRNGSQECRNLEIVAEKKLQKKLTAQLHQLAAESLDSSLSSLSLSLEVYFSDHMAYPTNTNALLVAGLYPAAQNSGIELTSYSLSQDGVYTIQLTHIGTGQCREMISSSISARVDCK